MLRIPAIFLVFLASGKYVVRVLVAFFFSVGNGRPYQGITMTSFSLFYVVVPIAATQISSNLEGRKMSVTRKIGSSAIITCDTIIESNNYIHWYRYQEGMAPHYLLYYQFSSSKTVVGRGINVRKYHVYEGTGRTCKLVLRNLEESDSGVYYCAFWKRHSDSDLTRLH